MPVIDQRDVRVTIQHPKLRSTMLETLSARLDAQS
jgi:hypothetical protein